jgi:hypothetical protein
MDGSSIRNKSGTLVFQVFEKTLLTIQNSYVTKRITDSADHA